MNRDDQDAALAHQQELEQQRRDEENEMLGSAEYMKWLTKLYSEKVNNEISSESFR